MNENKYILIQWRSSAPKSGGGGTNFFPEKQKKKKRKRKKKGHSGVKAQDRVCCGCYLNN